MTPPELKCERCRKQMRQVLQMPFGGEPIVQDWFAALGQPTRRVSELDSDMCEDCEVGFVKACEEAGVA